MNNPNDAEFKFAHTIKSRVDALVRESSVPICGANLQSITREGEIWVVEGPPITGIASGTLFRVDEESFLVTAAHVIGEFGDNELQLRIGMGNPQRPEPTPVSDQFVKVDTENDVAVLHLPINVVKRLSEKRFLTLDNVDRQSLSDDWYYALFGYVAQGPQSGKDFSQLLLHNFFYWTKVFGGKIMNESYSDDRHFLLRFAPGAVSFPDGIPQENPSPKGMSGCSVWQVFHPGHLDSGWSEESMKVVGVENLVYGEKAIRCTRWECVLPLFTALCPSVEGTVSKYID